MGPPNDGSGDRGEEVLYFAYGSNLSSTQMRDRCPLSPPVGLAHLSGWTWLINKRGYANVVQHQTATPLPPASLVSSSSSSSSLPAYTKEGENAEGGSENVKTVKAAELKDTEGVYGVLYRLHPDDEKALDRCEGVPWAYERRFLEAELVLNPATTSTTIDEKKKTETVRVLVYVDFKRVLPGNPKYEYIDRMNRSIDEAIAEWALPKSYVSTVIRPFIPDRREGN